MFSKMVAMHYNKLRKIFAVLLVFSLIVSVGISGTMKMSFAEEGGGSVSESTDSGGSSESSGSENDGSSSDGGSTEGDSSGSDEGASGDGGSDNNDNENSSAGSDSGNEGSDTTDGDSADDENSEGTGSNNNEDADEENINDGNTIDEGNDATQDDAENEGSEGGLAGPPKTLGAFGDLKSILEGSVKLLDYSNIDDRPIGKTVMVEIRYDLSTPRISLGSAYVNQCFITVSLPDENPQDGRFTTFINRNEANYTYDYDEYGNRKKLTISGIQPGDVGSSFVGVVFANGISNAAIDDILAELKAEFKFTIVDEDGIESALIDVGNDTVTIRGTADYNWSFAHTAPNTSVVAAEIPAGQTLAPINNATYRLTANTANASAANGLVYTDRIEVVQIIEMPKGVDVNTENDIVLATTGSYEVTNKSVTNLDPGNALDHGYYELKYTIQNTATKDRTGTYWKNWKELPNATATVSFTNLAADDSFVSGSKMTSKADIKYYDVYGHEKSTSVNAAITISRTKQNYYGGTDFAKDLTYAKAINLAPYQQAGGGSNNAIALIHPYIDEGDAQLTPTFTISGLVHPLQGNASSNIAAATYANVKILDDFRDLADYLQVKSVTLGAYNNYTGTVTAQYSTSSDISTNSWTNIGDLNNVPSTAKMIRFVFENTDNGGLPTNFSIRTAPSIQFEMRDGAFAKISALTAPDIRTNWAFVEADYTNNAPDNPVTGTIRAADYTPNGGTRTAKSATITFTGELPVSVSLNKTAKNPNPDRTDGSNYHYAAGDRVNYTLTMTLSKMDYTGGKYGATVINPVITDHIESDYICLQDDNGNELPITAENIKALAKVYYKVGSVTTNLEFDVKVTGPSGFTYWDNTTANAYTIQFDVRPDDSSQRYEIPGNATIYVDYSVYIKKDLGGQSSVTIRNEYYFQARNKCWHPGGTIPCNPGKTTGNGWNKIETTGGYLAIGLKKEVVNAPGSTGELPQYYLPGDYVYYKVTLKNLSDKNTEKTLQSLVFTDDFTGGSDFDYEFAIAKGINDSFTEITATSQSVNGLYTKTGDAGSASVTAVNLSGTSKNVSITFSGTSSDYFSADDEIVFHVRLKIKDTLSSSSAGYTTNTNTAKITHLPKGFVTQSPTWASAFRNTYADGNSGNYVANTAAVKVGNSSWIVALGKAATNASTNVDTISWQGSVNRTAAGPAYTIRVQNIGIEELSGAYIIDRLPVGQTIDTATLDVYSAKASGLNRIENIAHTLTVLEPGDEKQGQLIKITFDAPLKGSANQTIIHNDNTVYLIKYTSILHEDIIKSMEGFQDFTLTSVSEVNYVGLFAPALISGANVVKPNTNFNGAEVTAPAKDSRGNEIYGSHADGYSKVLQAQANVTYTRNLVKPGITKLLLSNQDELVPGDAVKFRIQATNGLSQAIDGFVIADILPEDFEFSATDSVTLGATTLTDANYSFSREKTSAGYVLVKWTFPKGVQITTANALTINYTTESPSTYFSGATNTAYFIPTDNAFSAIGAGQEQTAFQTKAAVGIERKSVLAQSAVDVFGAIKLRSMITATGQTVESGTQTVNSFSADRVLDIDNNSRNVTYTLELNNEGEAISKNIVLIDIFPYQNDTGVVAKNRIRGTSENWKLGINGTGVSATIKRANGTDVPLVPGTDYRVEFSNSVEDGWVLSDADWRGNGTAHWSTGGDGVYNAMRVVLNDTANATLNPATTKGGVGDRLIVSVSATIPNDAPDGSVAWNSFGYETGSSFFGFADDATRLRAEPPSVGIRIAKTSIDIDKYIVHNGVEKHADLMGIQQDFALDLYKVTEDASGVEQLEAVAGNPIILGASNRYHATINGLEPGATYRLVERETVDYVFETARANVYTSDVVLGENKVTFTLNTTPENRSVIDIVNTETIKIDFNLDKYIERENTIPIHAKDAGIDAEFIFDIYEVTLSLVPEVPNSEALIAEGIVLGPNNDYHTTIPEMKQNTVYKVVERKTGGYHFLTANAQGEVNSIQLGNYSILFTTDEYAEDPVNITFTNYEPREAEFTLDKYIYFDDGAISHASDANISKNFVFDLYELKGQGETLIQGGIVLNRDNGYHKIVTGISSSATYKLVERDTGGYYFVSAEALDYAAYVEVGDGYITFTTNANPERTATIAFTNSISEDPDGPGPEGPGPGGPGGGGSGGGGGGNPANPGERPRNPGTPDEYDLSDPDIPTTFLPPEEFDLEDPEVPTTWMPPDEELDIPDEDIPLARIPVLPVTGGAADFTLIFLGLGGILTGMQMKRKRADD